MIRNRMMLAASATLFLFILPVSAGAAEKPAAKPGADAGKQVARGRYLLIVGNCNDCHTPGFAVNEGNVPEKEWLLGSGALGFRGPWGTTYATNLRLSLSKMTEDQWVKYAKGLKTRPPMPWFNLNQWTDADLRAFYQYVRKLTPVGDPAPEPVPPGREPPWPYLVFPDKAPPKK
jgi:mono/diheme cytochrome c family protein